MEKVIKSVDTRSNGSVGTVEVLVFGNVQEVIEAYGEGAVLSILNAHIAAESSRIARAAFGKELSAEEVQALVDAFAPGIRSTRPTVKNFMALCADISETGKYEELGKAIHLNASEGVEAAFNYLMEVKLQG